MDWTAFAKSPFVWGLALGLLFFALSAWGHLGTKREFRRYRRHLSDKLDLDAAQLESLKKERETLGKENENLRVRIGMLGEKPDQKIIRDLEILHASREADDPPSAGVCSGVGGGQGGIRGRGGARRNREEPAEACVQSSIWQRVAQAAGECATRDGGCGRCPTERRSLHRGADPGQTRRLGCTVAWDFPLILPAGEFRGLIFDCDGTLIDSMPLHWRAWRFALEAQAAPFDFSEQMHHAFAGQSIPETVAMCNARHGCRIDPDRVEADRTEYFFSHLDELRVVSRSWTSPAHSSGGCRSQWPAKRPQHRRTRTHPPRPDRTFSRGGDRRRCPPQQAGARPFSPRRQRPWLAPETCLVFEDGKNGLLAAEAAGMQWLYVPTNE